jgi:death-on-curing protein
MSHPYSDGNKRSAFLVAAIFLELNGYDLGRTDDDVVETMRAVADKRMTEIELASWIRGGLTTL